jgi:hypothetical protein
MNTFFILPLLTYCKLEDGNKVINIGWFKKAWTINIEFNKLKNKSNDRQDSATSNRQVQPTKRSRY